MAFDPLHIGAGGLEEGTEAALPEIAAQISAAERRAMAAERDTIDRLVAHWLMDRVGATFAGRISGVTRAGLFVKLDETGADGFVPMSTLGSDFFVYDEARHAVIGRRTGEMHRLGDRVGARSGRTVARARLSIEPLGTGVGDRKLPLILRDLATDVCGNLRKRIDRRRLGSGASAQRTADGHERHPLHLRHDGAPQGRDHDPWANGAAVPGMV